MPSAHLASPLARRGRLVVVCSRGQAVEDFASRSNWSATSPRSMEIPPRPADAPVNSECGGNKSDQRHHGSSSETTILFCGIQSQT